MLSNPDGKAEDATSMQEERSDYRRSMKRSKSDDGQLDGRSPGPQKRASEQAEPRRTRALSPDGTSEDRGYGTLLDMSGSMDTKVTEIKDFMRLQSDKASTFSLSRSLAMA